MMTERQRLYYESEKKSWVIALFLVFLFGPFGLFYSRYVVVPLIVVLFFLAKICSVAKTVFVPDPEKFIDGLITIILVYVASLVLAPLLVNFRNKKVEEVAQTKF